MLENGVPNILEKDNKSFVSSEDWKVEVIQLDVGHGDAALVRFINKASNIEKNILIDGGPKATNITDRLMRNQYLGTDKKIDAIILSHLDEDHLQGMLNLSNTLLKPGETIIFRPSIQHTSDDSEREFYNKFKDYKIVSP